MYYIDGPDGTTKQVKKCLGKMSERAAQREHARILEEVNLKRGSIAPVPKGQSFADAVDKWRAAIAPNLSPATVRQRESHFRAHILPRFKHLGLHEIGVHELQSFATELRQSVSRNTTIGVLCTVFGVLEYAERCKMKVSGVKPGDIEYGSRTDEYEAPFFTREQAIDIITLAREPFKTLFTLAWSTGMRAGELMALTVNDLNFTNKTIRINKAADDNTRIVRQPKTKCSNTSLPMPSSLEPVLRNYLMHWKPNPSGFLFATRDGSRPRSRDNVVRAGLKPILKKLGIPSNDVGLHAFRHGLATQLCEASVPITVLKNQMRHSNVATTLRIYTHAIPQSQRDAMEVAAKLQPLLGSITLLKTGSK